MTTTTPHQQAEPSSTKSMDEIVALCRRRGFIFQSSEIYGGINGFWDYGPLGTLLKRNLKDAWWQDMVQQELIGPDGKPLDIVALDSTIIMNPEVWVGSGHVAGFNDPMVDDKETKQRFRADHLQGVFLSSFEDTPGGMLSNPTACSSLSERVPNYTVVASSPSEAIAILGTDKSVTKQWSHSFAGVWQAKSADELPAIRLVDKNSRDSKVAHVFPVGQDLLASDPESVPSPFTARAGSLTAPRQFNLMFESHAGVIRNDENKVYLRPETAQGIFVNFWNVLDTSRVKVPFGIAQIGKAFRNEVTPRNFTYRSREFEQMEIEFFIHPSEAKTWYDWWQQTRLNWWRSIGLTSDNLQLRAHEGDELSHYAKEGVGTSDVEYRFPFTAPGFGELEGVSHRADFDLKAHAKHTGKGDKLKYFDQEKNERYFPHVIEPSGGADRGTLAVLCEAFTPTPERSGSKYVMKFHPRLAPIKAGVFPLVNKDGMPEIAEKLYRQLRKRWTVQYDAKQSIGKRYARMDEAGTPYCFTIDSDTLEKNIVTVRDRDTATQESIAIDQVEQYLADRIGG
jgi:glycyl-tRNA synthetase